MSQNKVICELFYKLSINMMKIQVGVIRNPETTVDNNVYIYVGCGTGTFYA